MFFGGGEGCLVRGVGVVVETKRWEIGVGYRLDT